MRFQVEDRNRRSWHACLPSILWLNAERFVFVDKIIVSSFSHDEVSTRTAKKLGLGGRDFEVFMFFLGF